MSASTADQAPRKRLGPFAVPAGICFVVWTAGGAAGHWVGIWSGVGTVAIALGTVMAALNRRHFAEALRPTAPRVAWGVAGGLLMLAVTYGLYGPSSGAFPFIGSQTASLYADFRAIPLPLMAFLLPAVIICEELVWRGIVLEAGRERWGSFGGVILASAAYALAHAFHGSPLLVLIAFCCGLYWGAMRELSGSVVAPLVAHLIWDALVFVWLPLSR